MIVVNNIRKCIVHISQKQLYLLTSSKLTLSWVFSFINLPTLYKTSIGIWEGQWKCSYLTRSCTIVSPYQVYKTHLFVLRFVIYIFFVLIISVNGKYVCNVLKASTNCIWFINFKLKSLSDWYSIHYRSGKDEQIGQKSCQINWIRIPTNSENMRRIYKTMKWHSLLNVLFIKSVPNKLVVPFSHTYP